ncbi:hypothetical protein X975_23366, partial [Stegodyphus mimosarum]
MEALVIPEVQRSILNQSLDNQMHPISLYQLLLVAVKFQSKAHLLKIPSHKRKLSLHTKDLQHLQDRGFMYGPIILTEICRGINHLINVKSSHTERIQITQMKV